MFNRSKLWAVALLAAVFGTGVLSGWAIQAWAEPGRQRERGRGTEAMVTYLTGELDLTAAQQDSVRAVLVRHRPAMRALWESVRPHMDSLRQALRDGISAQLTPPQAARYRELIAAQEHRHRTDSANTTTGDRK